MATFAAPRITIAKRGIKMVKNKFIAVIAAVVTIVSSAPVYASPFADVPSGHWAYDAVGYLAASGVVSGYPDGLYKGEDSASRYEMASVVARALENVDRTKASEKDMELLRKLAIEFSDELTAMGVRLDDIDSRLAVMEEDLGGWQINGRMVFGMNWGENESNRHAPQDSENWSEFTEGNISLTKALNDGSYVFARFALERDYDNGGDGNEDIIMDRLYWQGALGDNILLTAGRFSFDWEADARLYHPGENAGWLTNGVVDGFRGSFSANSWGAEAIVARNIGFDSYPMKRYEDIDAGLYALKLNAYLSERGEIGAFYSLVSNDGDDLPTDITSYGGWLSWEFYPGASIRGLYFTQEFDDLDVDDPDAWKAVIELDDQLLGFTSLWAEYGQIDKFFAGTTENAYNWSDGYGSSIYKWGLADADVWMVRADQTWNDQWSTFLRYAQNEFDLDGADTIKNWTVGVNYQMTPAVGFQLAYDEIDYGNMAASFNLTEDKDRLIRFRTVVNF